MRMLIVPLLMALSAPALAEPIDSDDSEPTSSPGPVSHRVNLRAGLASSDEVGRPTICLEVVALWGASVEGCGTGSGILHDEAGRQIAHFRLNVPLLTRPIGGGQLALRGGAGFAELEVGDDRPGFDFGEADNVAAVAGPDGAVSVQWLRPVGAGVELVANATTGVAWFSGADQLVVPQRHVQPYVAFELGVGW